MGPLIKIEHYHEERRRYYIKLKRRWMSDNVMDIIEILLEAEFEKTGTSILTISALMELSAKVVNKKITDVEIGELTKFDARMEEA